MRRFLTWLVATSLGLSLGCTTIAAQEEDKSIQPEPGPILVAQNDEQTMREVWEEHKKNKNPDNDDMGGIFDRKPDPNSDTTPKTTIDVNITGDPIRGSLQLIIDQASDLSMDR